MSVLFRADLSAQLRGRHFAVCYVEQQEAQASSRPTTTTAGRSVSRYFPQAGQAAEDFTEERCRELVRMCVGTPTSTWSCSRSCPGSWPPTCHVLPGGPGAARRRLRARQPAGGRVRRQTPASGRRTTWPGSWPRRCPARPARGWSRRTTPSAGGRRLTVDQALMRNAHRGGDEARPARRPASSRTSRSCSATPTARRRWRPRTTPGRHAASARVDRAARVAGAARRAGARRAPPVDARPVRATLRCS